VDLFAEVVALAAALDVAAVDYAICGGVALAIHGAPRATKDILLAEGALESVWQTRARVTFATTDAPESALWVVSRGGLITLKLAAGRPQDIVDVQRLQEVSRGEHDT
jgi:hypothetical protein